MPQLGETVGSCANRDGIRLLSEDPATGIKAAAARRGARAIDALKRGWAVRIDGTDGVLIIKAVETATISHAGPITGMLLSASRAATLKLANQIAAADTAMPVLIAIPTDIDAASITAIADPTLDLRHPLKGPFQALPLPSKTAAVAAMELARHAGLLPAFLVVQDAGDAAGDDSDDDIDTVTQDDVGAYADAGMLHIAARARLPVAANEDAEIIAFRTDADATDHIALVIGQRDSSAPVVRLHSECLTGDVLSSLKCDCGPQLHEALHQIAGAQWGVLLYLRQEGRGIGLINKLRAYALQDQGYDTVDANVRLGFAVDARDFAVAAKMLHLLGIGQLKLLTNNPQKVAGLEAEGIVVAARLPLQITANPHNSDYLDTKRDRTGHSL